LLSNDILLILPGIAIQMLVEGSPEEGEIIFFEFI
jgi:hypothetical protein